MDLAKLVRNGVALADSLTSSLQAMVQHRAATTGTYGVTLGAAVARPALIEEKARKVRRSDGTEAEATHRVTFLRKVAVTVDDRITLPNGSTGQILAVSGMTDPATGRYFTVVDFGIRTGNG